VWDQDRVTIRTHKKSKLMEVRPADGHHYDAVVVVLHGYGDTAAGWYNQCSDWGNGSLAHSKFVIPSAPFSQEEMAHSWFNIKSGERLSDAQDLVLARVNAEMDGGIHPARIVFLGFSQGGMLSMLTALGAEGRNKLPAATPFGGVVVLSSALLQPHDLKLAPQAAQTPVLYCYGGKDDRISPDHAKKTVELLQKSGVPVQFKLYPGLGHEVRPDVMADVLYFLERLIPCTSAS
jgi:predicted esterase